MFACARAARRAAVTLTTVTALAAATAAAATAPATAARHPLGATQITFRPACPSPAQGQMACLAIIDSTPAGKPLTRAQATADGLQPYLAASLQSAYKLPSELLGERQTIAIVDAYNNPDAAANLTRYRAANKLPACTTASGCFEKVNQDGKQGSYPAANASWALEESLDVDMASAICPHCHIILVEASSNANSDLYAAEDEAATLGASVISNSWGSTEYTGEASDCGTYFDHPGIAITAGAGDSGYEVNFPAACTSVTAVGGTTLYQNTSKRGWDETAWSYNPAEEWGTGSGCSAYIAKPAWQHDKLCGMRTVGDVSAVADPDTPVAVYDTYGTGGTWLAVGGTSAATPIIAGVYALAGNTAAIGTGAAHIYAHHQDLYDVTSGSNATPGNSCGGSYLCTARKGYDGPTGWGTPHGIGAF
ncbi:MAG TPA: S53 family peptidase [Streptosporangiaceae bacterium]